MDTPRRLNSTELSWEEFQDNILLRYGIVPLNLPTDCDVCGKNFSVPHDLSWPRGGLVIARQNDVTTERGALLARILNPSAIS